MSKSDARFLVLGAIRPIFFAVFEALLHRVQNSGLFAFKARWNALKWPEISTGPGSRTG